MQTSDLFGHTAPKADFRDIRNTRPSIAEEKARLALELHRLVKVPPKSLASASVNAVRVWRAAHESACKVLASTGSSCAQLESAINSLRGFE